MSEHTALLLAALSHRWLGLAATIPVVLVATMYGVGHWRVRLRRRSGAGVRRVAAAAQAVLGGLLAGSLIVFAAALVHLGCAALVAQQAACSSNLRRLSTAMLMYSQDYDERMPPSSTWSEGVASRLGKVPASAADRDAGPFRCPAAESPASYGMNAELSGIPIEQLTAPAETVLLFDADAPTRSFAGGPANVAWGRHSEAPNIAFADGHVRFANRYVRARLNWSPRGLGVSGAN